MKLNVLLIILIFTLVGCKEIPKNELIEISKDTLTNNENKEVDNDTLDMLIDKDIAIDTAINAYKNYLNTDLKKISKSNQYDINVKLEIKKEGYNYNLVDYVWDVQWIDNNGNIRYACKIDAKSANVIGIKGANIHDDYNKQKYINPSMSFDEYKNICIDFIDKFKLLDKDSYSLFKIKDSKENISFVYRYDLDEFLDISINKKENKVEFFSKYKIASYNIDDTNMNITKDEAAKIVLTNLNKYFNINLDTSNFVENIVYDKKQKIWFIYYEDLNSLKGSTYGGNVNETSGQLEYIGYYNFSDLFKSKELKFNQAKNIVHAYMHEINLSHNNLSFTRDEFSNDMQTILNINDNNCKIESIYVNNVKKKISGITFRK